MAWLSRLKEAQVKYKNAVKQTHNSVSSSDDSNTRRSRRSSSNVTQNDNIATTTTTTTKSTSFSRARSPRDSRVSLGPTTLLTGHHRMVVDVVVDMVDHHGGHHRMVVPSASLNSAFWSSTSSDRRSTTSSLHSVSMLRSLAIVCPSVCPYLHWSVLYSTSYCLYLRPSVRLSFVTSSLQSVSTFRGGSISAYGKAVISRTSSAGPAMRGYYYNYNYYN